MLNAVVGSGRTWPTTFTYEKKSNMEKFVPYEKLSKKERQKRNKAKRGIWGDINPVTRKPVNSKAYNRKQSAGLEEDSSDLRSAFFAQKTSSVSNDPDPDSRFGKGESFVYQIFRLNQAYHCLRLYFCIYAWWNYLFSK